ncbi:hypothetical protein D0T49_00430 [Paludibacter sp. 221]|uniref:hypothetical protein n=1 Tax=Paludibacter sp. 221 TaxID=2302939 RepID=UPI0013D624AC|nr:hypothetical protein [Paludibacter sp. 221]NDV45519.1 hypothetical protein [Paludibacter sp. 221]
MYYYIHNNSIFAFAKALPEGYKTSDKYEDRYTAYVLLSDKQATFYEANKTATVYEVWNMKLNDILVLSPADQRQAAYATQPIIDWQGEMITVDEANKLFLDYSAEGKAEIITELQGLIREAKEAIRGQYKG